VGSFNPRIFQPAWFAAEGLIRKAEADEATIEVIHPEVVSFHTELFHVQVVADRFAASTGNPSFYEPIRDLVVGTFRILSHTPVYALGLNRDGHFRVDSAEAWHALGNRLVPKEPWDNLLEKPGMRSLTVEGVRPDGRKGYIRVRVEPSVKVLPHGVYVAVNDHYEVQDKAEALGCREALDVIDSSWRSFMDRTSIATALITSVTSR
jgi:hypothetical protein